MNESAQAEIHSVALLHAKHMFRIARKIGLVMALVGLAMVLYDFLADDYHPMNSLFGMLRNAMSYIGIQLVVGGWLGMRVHIVNRPTQNDTELAWYREWLFRYSRPLSEIWRDWFWIGGFVLLNLLNIGAFVLLWKHWPQQQSVGVVVLFIITVVLVYLLYQFNLKPYRRSLNAWLAEHYPADPSP
jgi:hypothetical protein